MTIVGNENQFIWVERYRPSRINDCILPQDTKAMFKGYVESGRIPNLLLVGSAGTGKTTIARALCEEVGADYIIINASKENGIDTLRVRITQFASTASFSEAKKVIILDEADNMSPAFQQAFRNSLEEFAQNCTFILTCNFPNRIIDPIHSRCGVINFKIKSAEKPALAAAFFKRVCQILDAEEVEYDKRVVASLVEKFFPDFRRVLNELQKFSSSGKIDDVILTNFDETAFDELIVSLKNKKFNEMRKWVANHSDVDTSEFFKLFYDKLSDKVVAKYIPEIILLMGQYQFWSSQVADQEINTAAFLTEIIRSPIEWK